ncbi:MAG TPA: hypothetical protein VF160_08260 [Candidatus Dormibacteraeota bacterium]
MAPVFAACASLLALATPAAAASELPVTLTLAERWQTPAAQGTWTPYVATVRNDGAADFSGEIYLTPIDSRNNLSVRGIFPEYRALVTVPRGSSRSVTFYVFQPPAGYQAELRDTSGRTLVSGVATSATGSGYAVGVLSDQPEGDQRIQALRPMPDSSVRFSRFASAQAFPTNAAFLSGLQAIVIDDFDSNSLSDAQARALRDFVGLGGGLVVAGGSSWRRTLLPLGEFGPFRPAATDQASIRPLGNLVGAPVDLLVPIATGTMSAGRVLVGAPGGQPLVVEGEYGAGKIVELLFDPLAEPLSTSDSGMSALAWTLAMDRALLTQANPNQAVKGFIGAPVNGPQAPPPPGSFSTPEDLYSVLGNTPAGSVPPVGLIGGLLVLYVLLAGPVNYAALKGMRRRELMWVTVPAVAIAFTATAYLAGLGQRGVNFLDSEVQVVKVAPDGALEVQAYHGIFTPRRGDFTVTVAPNTMASTALSVNIGGGSASETAVVDNQSRPRVVMQNSAYDSMRTLQTLTVGRAPAQPAVGVEAHLRLSQGRIVGTLRNTGDRPLQQVVLVSGTGQQAVLTPDLGAKATVTVNASLEAASQRPFETGTASSTGDYRRPALLRIATSQVVDGRNGVFNLVALTDSYGTLDVDGTTPSRTSVAAVVQPVSLEAVDALSGIAPRPELVAQTGAIPFHYDVYDLRVPAGYTGPVKLQYLSYMAASSTPAGFQPPVKDVEVYDWSTDSWRALPAAVAGQPQRALTVDLAPGELAGGVVRIRAQEQNTGVINSSLQLVAS